jgi:Domain of unknown function (DUF1835)
LRHSLGCEPGSVLVQHDPLSVGPLPPVDDIGEWNGVRDAFWKGVLGDSGLEKYEWDLTRHTDALRGHQAVCVWVGTGASDQLLLPWVVQLFHLQSLQLPELSVVQFDHLPGRKRSFEVIGLGMLSPENIGKHPPAEIVSPEAIVELQRTWAALTNPHPNEVLRMIDDGPCVFPFLYRALRTWLDRFPDRKGGLSHWDSELLKHARSAGPAATRILGDTLAASYDANYPESVGDHFLFGRLQRLGSASLPEPAVTLRAGEPDSYRGWEVRVTEAGEAFLQGERNFVKTNGIDEWVAGVRLHSDAGELWYRDGDRLVAGSAV